MDDFCILVLLLVNFVLLLVLVVLVKFSFSYMCFVSSMISLFSKELLFCFNTFLTCLFSSNFWGVRMNIYMVDSYYSFGDIGNWGCFSCINNYVF